MDKMRILHCKRMLEAKRAEILSSPHDTESMAVERVPDSIDEVTLEVERHMVVEALSRKSALLRQVTEALERIARGKYGACQACQEAISPKRLAALPWAALCIECQQAAEGRPSDAPRPSAGLRLGYSLHIHGQPLAGASGFDHRLRRLANSGASTDGGSAKSESEL